jgi:hypothetical protein
VAKCDKEGQPEYDPRSHNRIEVDTTHEDIHNNWDTTHSVNVFLPAKAFDGEKIDATKNRHISSVMF